MVKKEEESKGDDEQGAEISLEFKEGEEGVGEEGLRNGVEVVGEGGV